MKRLVALLLSALLLTSCVSGTVPEEKTDAINSLDRNEKHDWY